MAVNRTVIQIPSQNTSYSVPADLSPQQVVEMYGAQIQGLSNMTHTATVSTTPTGEERVITFTQRSGNKG